VTLPNDVLAARSLWRPDGLPWGDDGNRLIAARLVRVAIEHEMIE